MSTGFFVTGTDTEVGKTFIGCALLHALQRRHAKVVGMKPVASGAITGPDGQPCSEDALALRRASTLQVRPELDNPYLLPLPVSPHVAAQRAGVALSLAAIENAHRALSAQAEAVVVEGAGGWLVPLGPGLCMADVALALQRPVIVVVGIRLGCINHALLTAQAIRHSGLPLCGWVANRVDPHALEADASVAYLQATLAARFGAPLLADVPWQADPDPSRVDILLPTEP